LGTESGDLDSIKGGEGSQKAEIRFDEAGGGGGGSTGSLKKPGNEEEVPP
jgi:hypothetical protein